MHMKARGKAHVHIVFAAILRVHVSCDRRRAEKGEAICRSSMQYVWRIISVASLFFRSLGVFLPSTLL